ncbi:hypothetical protein C2H92_09865 [Bacillus halotolerans]|nr:hypothetical protein C2H92_09865 [Bacillus halotolerans]
MTCTIPDSFRQSSAILLLTDGEKERKVMKASAAEIAKMNENSRTLCFQGSAMERRWLSRCCLTKSFMIGWRVQNLAILDKDKRFSFSLLHS